MLRRFVVSGLACGCLALLPGCNKEQASSAPEPSAEPSADASAAGEPESSAPAEAPAAKVWADMNRDERKKHMGLVVMPAMKDLFTAHDAERYGEFKCQTCHGDDWTEVDFKMPNAITPLDRADPHQSGKDLDEEMAVFMIDSVTPKMAEMLGRENSPDRCFDCHLAAE